METEVIPINIFDDVCQGLAQATEPPPESIVAVRSKQVGLWLTAPTDSDLDSRRRLLSLAGVVADASLLIYMAEARLNLDGQHGQDAMLLVSFTPNDPMSTKVVVRPFEMARSAFRLKRRYGQDIHLTDSAMLAPLITDLRSTDELRRDPPSRIAALQALIGNKFDLQINPWLDEELAALL